MCLSSLIRFSEPLSLKIPSTPVAKGSRQQKGASRASLPAKLTFLFQKDSTFGHDNGHVTAYAALAVVVDVRYGNVCVRDALSQRNTEYTGSSTSCYEALV